MDRATAEKAIDLYISTAKKAMSMFGHHGFFFFILTPEGAFPIDASPLLEASDEARERGNAQAAERAKDTIATQVRRIAKERKAEGVVHIFEAWLSVEAAKALQILGGDEPGMAKAAGMIARYAPDRKEILSVIWEFRLDSGERVDGVWTGFFERDGGRIKFTREERNDVAALGRFTGLLT